jgi:hypothetical protein
VFCQGEHSPFLALRLIPAAHPAVGVRQSRLWYNGTMTRDQVKEILERVTSWPPEDQERLVRIIDEIEQRHADDITDEEWEVIEARARRRELASDAEVEQVFARYRSA